MEGELESGARDSGASLSGCGERPADRPSADPPDHPACDLPTGRVIPPPVLADRRGFPCRSYAGTHYDGLATRRCLTELDFPSHGRYGIPPA